MDQKKLFKFASLWVGTTILALILSYATSDKFVLGNVSVTRSFSGIIIGFVLTSAFFLAEPIAKKLDIKIKDERAWAGIFFVVNSGLVWVLKRFADFTGVGVSSIIFVLIVAAILTAGQYYLDKYAERMLKSK